MSVHQACGIFGLIETVYYYKAKDKSEDVVIENELRTLAQVHTLPQAWAWSNNNKSLHCPLKYPPPPNSC